MCPKQWSRPLAVFTSLRGHVRDWSCYKSGIEARDQELYETHRTTRPVLISRRVLLSTVATVPEVRKAKNQGRPLDRRSHCASNHCGTYFATVQVSTTRPSLVSHRSSEAITLYRRPAIPLCELFRSHHARPCTSLRSRDTNFVVWVAILYKKQLTIH